MSVLAMSRNMDPPIGPNKTETPLHKSHPLPRTYGDRPESRQWHRRTGRSPGGRTKLVSASHIPPLLRHSTSQSGEGLLCSWDSNGTWIRHARVVAIIMQFKRRRHIFQPLSMVCAVVMCRACMYCAYQSDQLISTYHEDYLVQ